jgi:oligosaccharide repeat unit polymerase
MNAYATLFYDFYMDFGYIGVALLSFLFGYLCMRSYKYYKRIGDMRSLVLYLILLQFIMFSMARIYTVLATRALSLLWLLIMFKKEENSINGI